ncbi:MAG: DUF2157 domain-containing protein [Spirochaetota bacterium]|mgnify:FL=1
MDRDDTPKTASPSRSFINHLLSELPVLISSNVISAKTADDIRRYYDSRAAGDRRNTAFIVFGIAGSVLVGLGIMLLIAYNWGAMTRSIKTVLTFALLAAGIAASAYAYFVKRSSRAWGESAGTVHFLFIGAVIAVIGQIYHIPADTGAFMLTWMLLAVPLVYLLNASAPALLYIVGITAWAGYAQSEGGHALIFWPLAAVIAWHFIRHFRENPYSVRSSFIAWGYSLAACVSIGISLEKVVPGLWVIIYSSYLAILFLIGGMWFEEAPTIWQRPFYIIGAIGTAVISLIFTFGDCWYNVGIHHYRAGGRFHSFAAIPDYILLIGLFSLAVHLFIVALRKHRRVIVLVFGALPFVTLGCYLLAMFKAPVHPISIFNLYSFVLGVAAIVHGIRYTRQGIVNGGMLILAVLIGARFVDMHMSLLIRAVIFLIIGASFLVTNAVLARMFKRGRA